MKWFRWFDTAKLVYNLFNCYNNKTYSQDIVSVLKKFYKNADTDDATPFVAKTQLEYYDSGLPKKKIENYGGSKPLTADSIEYDACGNLTKSRISGSGVKAVATRI